MNLNVIKSNIKRNAPTILTGLGVVGVIGTTISGITATPKAIKLLEIENEYKLERDGEELDLLEKAILVTPIYLPTLLLGIGTISCIVGSNKINTNRQAMLTSAYAYLNSSFNEYKETVNKLYGEDADHKVDMKIAEERYNDSEIEYIGEEKLFYDKFSKRYFQTTLYKLQNAIYQLNKIYAIEGEASLNDFYDCLGLEKTDYGDVIGWNGICQWEFTGYAWIDVDWKTMEMPDDLECYILEYDVEPKETYSGF